MRTIKYIVHCLIIEDVTRVYADSSVDGRKGNSKQKMFYEDMHFNTSFGQVIFFFFFKLKIYLCCNAVSGVGVAMTP